jgi:hypothetical protein
MPDDAIERAAVEIATRMVPGRFGDDGKRYMSLRQADDWTVAKRAALLAFASQQAPGMVLVPIDPTEEMWGGLARSIMMWLDFDRKTPGALFKHLEASGVEIPQWLRDEPEMKRLDHVPSKGTRCVILYRAMLDAAPSVTLGEVG